jgi:hypothetical protein
VVKVLAPGGGHARTGGETMPIGPVELLVVKFPGNQFTGEIVPALTELVENGTIEVLDILFLNKDADGKVEMVEIKDLEIDDFSFDPLISDVTDLLTEEDVAYFGTTLAPNSSAAMMLFENTWAARFATAVRAAKGELVLNERIPHAVIEELMATATVA